MKTREQKDQDIAVLRSEFDNVSNALMISFQGLTVEKDWELRKALRDAQLTYRVVKNTLGRRAVEGTEDEMQPKQQRGVGNKRRDKQGGDRRPAKRQAKGRRGAH